MNARASRVARGGSWPLVVATPSKPAGAVLHAVLGRLGRPAVGS